MIKKSKETIYHLLIPKEFGVYCMGERKIGENMNLTRLPSKSNCANCLTRYRQSKGIKSGFRVKWTNRHEPRERTPALDE